MRKIIGPEFAGVLQGRAGEGEALGPHALGEEVGDGDDAVAEDAVLGLGSLELLLDGEGEEAEELGLEAVEELDGDAVAAGGGDLERAPHLAGMDQFGRGFGVGEVDGGEGVGGDGVVVGRPAVGLRDFGG